MPDQETAEAHMPITIGIDVDQLLKSELGWTVYNAGDEPGYAPGGNGRIIDVVAVKLAEAIKEDVREVVREAVRDKALEKVDTLIDEVMSTPITLTSTYGEPKSPEMTMREAMIKAMTDRLEEKVDDQDKRLGQTFGSYDRGSTYLQWRATQTARVVMDKEFTQRLSEAAKQIKASATDLVSKRIAEVLGRAL